MSAPSSLVIAGITVSVAGGAAADDDGTAVTVSELFSRLAANRTVVKARGTFGAGVLTADEVSIE